MDMQPFDASQPQWQRAWRDTAAAIHSGWWFWAAEVTLAAVASVFAVSLYREDSSRLEQAAIQAAVVVTGFVLFGLLVLLANLVAWSPHRQRNEARLEVERLNAGVAEREKHRLTRQQLVEARQQLGILIGDAGNMLIGQSSDKSFDDEVSEFFGHVVDLLQSDNQVFDGSHSGRFYAAATKATMEAETITTGGLRHILQAEIECLNGFISEINAELLTLPR